MPELNRETIRMRVEEQTLVTMKTQPANNIKIDKTLTKENQAAEAKATGDRIAEEATARAAADTALQQSIAAETAVRASTDTALQQSLEAETAARASAVSAEIANRENGDTLLQSQIDQIIAPSGEAPSAAEVENARIDVDGVTHTTLVEAIREQVGDLKSQIAKRITIEEFDYSAITEYSHFAINSVGQWTSSIKQESYTLAIPNGVEKIRVTSGANGSIIALLNSYEPVAVEAVDFSDGYSGRISLRSGETAEYIVHDGMNYLFALITTQAGVDFTPRVELFCTTDSTLTKQGIAADAKSAGDKINEVLGIVPVVDNTLSTRAAAADALVVGHMQDAIVRYADYQMKKTGLLSLIWFRGNLQSDGTVASNPDQSTAVVTDYMPMLPNTTFRYKKSDSVNIVRICEYAADKSFLTTTTLRAVYTRYTVGESTEYIRIGYSRANSQSEPTVIYPEYAYRNFYAYIPDAGDISIPLGLHTMPKNQGVLNCIKRARQMTDIKWSVAADIDRVNIVSGQHYSDTKNYFQNKFKAGHEYTGLPYSEQRFIGVRRGITAFVTAAANADSKECTASQYAGDHNIASYFGTVCVTLVSYALHAPQIPSPTYTNMVGLTKMYDLVENDAYHDIDDLELCDVLWEHGHVAIITDITHDDLGHVLSVEVSESTKFGSYLINNGNGDFGGKCRRKSWTKDEFLQWFSSFAVYRYDAKLLASIPYEANKYVPMVDETPYADDPNLPCIPEEGDHAYFYLSNASQLDVKVLIRETGYTYLRVKQNGNNFALINVTGLTEVTVSCEAGKEAVYEAYFCNMNGDAETYTSASCFWVELGGTASPTVQANSDGSYTFSIIRETNVAYPFVVVYNGTDVKTGAFSQITEYAVTSVSNGYRYRFTVAPPSGTTINTFSLMFDAGEYGWFNTSTITPS